MIVLSKVHICSHVPYTSLDIHILDILVSLSSTYPPLWWSKSGQSAGSSNLCKLVNIYYQMRDRNKVRVPKWKSKLLRHRRLHLQRRPKISLNYSPWWLEAKPARCVVTPFHCRWRRLYVESSKATKQNLKNLWHRVPACIFLAITTSFWRIVLNKKISFCSPDKLWKSAEWDTLFSNAIILLAVQCPWQQESRSNPFGIGSV